jgi:1-acyl-sn-glycerol-3-phosphate acyltransferase
VPRLLNKCYGITGVECRGVEHLRESLGAGHGILLTPNHCRESDPLVLGGLSAAVGRPFFLLASWHLFMQGRLRAFLLRRAGAFSIYREGMDRAAIKAATDILEQARRPLVIFPEGVLSRTNDHLNALMDGTALIARAAARRCAKLNPPRQVVVHPVAIRYHFRGDLQASLSPVLDRIESRLTWRPQRDLPLIERVYKLGFTLLSLKEIEYLGQVSSDSIHDRLHRLIDHLLVPLEKEWLDGRRDDTTVARVKRLRAAILPDLVKGDIDEPERDRRWRHLADVYLAQQLAHYPPDYIRSDPTPDRLLETVERFEEDLTDVCTTHRPFTAAVHVAPAIHVTPDIDDLMPQIEGQLRQLLDIAQGEPTDVPA